MEVNLRNRRGVRGGSAMVFLRNSLAVSTMARVMLLRNSTSGSEMELKLTGRPWMAFTLSMGSAFMMIFRCVAVIG